MEEVSMFEVDDEHQRARLEAMLSIMGEMGWKWFITEINQEVSHVDLALRTVATEIELGRLQGRRDAFEQILAFEENLVSLQERQEELA
jgi:hypothetical protein